MLVENVKLGPKPPWTDAEWVKEGDRLADAIVAEVERRRNSMHYRNGREAKNGDKIVQISGFGTGAEITQIGVLYDAKPGNDHCNGQIAVTQIPGQSACLCDCLHVDDLAELLKEKGLDKRPAGK